MQERGKTKDEQREGVVGSSGDSLNESTLEYVVIAGRVFPAGKCRANCSGSEHVSLAESLSAAPSVPMLLCCTLIPG